MRSISPSSDLREQNRAICLRPMLPGDLEIVANIEQASHRSPWSTRIFHDSLRAGHHCLVMEQASGEELLGYGVMMLAADECHLLNLCIHPNHQRTGLGRLLLRRLLAIARKKRAISAFLEVRESNLPALGLYRAEGFNEIGLRRNYYPAPPSGREHAVLMGCAL